LSKPATPSQPQVAELDDFAILSSVWILASNDENNIITYASVRHRLGLAADFPLEDLVAARGDLFRRSVRPDRLESWKAAMRQGKHLPAWIRQMSAEEQAAWIEKLAPMDCFRSQFRAGGSAPRSPVEIIDWGLKHLDRLRDVRARARDERARRWTAFWIPVVSTAVAIAAVIAGMVQSSSALRAQSTLKQYELSFTPKQQGYARLMHDHLLLYQAVTQRNDSARQAFGNDMESAYYELEPFLADSLRTAVRDAYRQFLYLSFVHPESRAYMSDTFPLRADSSRLALRRLLYPALFRGGAPGPP
jgi:hypothetical protein